MNIQDYRRQLEQEIDAERTAAEEPRWEAGLESLGAPEALGAATGGDDDAERLRTVLASRDADPQIRMAALGSLASRHSDPATAHEEALRCLGDETESASLRSAALQLLKVAAFHSPTFKDWRPAYLEALRSASRSDHETLRQAAFEVLAVMKDRESQTALLEGLQDPGTARVAPEHALRLLALDPHSGIRDVARAHADAPASDASRFEALRALAGDSDSVDRFRKLVTDGAETAAVRKLAATALSSLDRPGLRAAHAEIEAAPRPESLAPAGEDPVDRHIAALLELPE